MGYGASHPSGNHRLQVAQQGIKLLLPVFRQPSQALLDPLFMSTSHIGERLLTAWRELDQKGAPVIGDRLARDPAFLLQLIGNTR